MKVFNPAWAAALAAGEAVSHGAIRIATSGYDPLRIWGGFGQLNLPHPTTGAPEPYLGVGDRGLVTVAAGQLGSGEDGTTITLSGVDPDIEIDLKAAKRAPVVIWRLGFDLSGRNLLDARIYTRGRIDELTREETVGGPAMLVAKIEGAVRGMGRHRARMRSDADQRMVSGSDAGFATIATAGEKNLYWGGSKPVRASNALSPQGQQAGLIQSIMNQLR